MTLFTSITHDQCDELEEIFATLTPSGWIIPEWLLVLRYNASGLDIRETSWGDPVLAN